jgi:hypothetical protein
VTGLKPCQQTGGRAALGFVGRLNACPTLLGVMRSEVGQTKNRRFQTFLP